MGQFNFEASLVHLEGKMGQLEMQRTNLGLNWAKFRLMQAELRLIWANLKVKQATLMIICTNSRDRTNLRLT